ncbi:MAG TPA: endonuclease/exonuclease/phosphatase family protein [Pyrinomonadaceae bacterium]|nr:endonuclease/exonuclease/phosphatase family protein [Pyrinomonadaceae bacterium]
MKRILFVLVTVVLGWSCAASAYGQQEALIVGWNIAGVEAIPDERVAEITEVIRRLNPDLIVLSEVNPNDVPERIVEALGNDYQPPVILPQKPEVVQNIALIFKNGVTVTGARLIDGTDLQEEPRSRRALTANVRIGNFDFILIAVHLKSERIPSARAKRTRQCTAIANFIAQATAGNEKDVLVVGDYNMIPPNDDDAHDQVNFVAMSPTNFLRFVSTDFLLGQTSHISRCNPLRGNLLDGFAISRTFTGEFIPGSTRLITFNQLGTNCSEFEDNVSDHRPIASRFRTSAADDD